MTIMVYDEELERYVKAKKQNVIYNTNPIPINDDIKPSLTNDDVNNKNDINNDKNLIPIKKNVCCIIM